MATKGFGPFNLGQFVIKDPLTGNSTPLPYKYTQAITNCILQRTIMGSSTLTMQLADPDRTLLRGLFKKIYNVTSAQLAAEKAKATAGQKKVASGYDVDRVGQGVSIVVDGLDFTLVQFVKASDYLQLTFESSAVYRLRNQRGQTKSETSFRVTPFMQHLATAPNGIKFFGANYAQYVTKLTGLTESKRINQQLVRGTQSDAYEDSWTAMSRTAATIGWRLWESGNTVYFGPDEYWLGTLTGTPMVNSYLGLETPTLKEFGRKIQLIDFDWDVGKPYGQANVTCTLDDWNYEIGQAVRLDGMGPANGLWIVAGMQRDMFMPQATLSLQVPMPLRMLVEPTSLPVNGFPLTK
jgi:hypothetical protein